MMSLMNHYFAHGRAAEAVQVNDVSFDLYADAEASGAAREAARGGAKMATRPGHEGEIPFTYHPIVRTHPETGRKSLFVNPGHTTKIEDMDQGESRKLLNALFEHSLQPKFIYRHKWQAGDTVVWDNRRVMHNAETYDMERYTRHMHRSCIHGDRPF